MAHNQPDSAASWRRLAVGFALGTIGGVGMWSYVVVLPAIQAEFGVSRAWAAVPYTATILGVGAGGVLMGRLSDRFGIIVPVLISAVFLLLGYTAAAYAQTLWQFALAQGLLIGLFGSSAVFGPMMAEISRWFVKRRGIAVGICACGNYVAGTIWPPVVQHFIETVGWRTTHIGIGVFCCATMLPLALLLRSTPPAHAAETPGMPGISATGTAAALQPGTLQVLLLIAGVACCVAMSMPQVHLVAYCGDLGYGPARGAEMLAVMMAFGAVSRLASGWISDRIGGLATLLAGSVLQAVALLLYVPFTGLASLYVISALFGIIIREYFPAREAGTRLGLVIFATLIGMALGGWMSGRIYDVTGSYQWAFINGIAWNMLNGAITVWLLWRLGRPMLRPMTVAA